MNDIFRVQVLKALDDFIDDFVDKFGVESLLIPFDEIEEVMCEVLEDEIDFSFFLEGLLDVDDVVSFEHFEHLDLPLNGSS